MESSVPSGSKDIIRQELLEQQALALLATLLQGAKDPVITEVGSLYMQPSLPVHTVYNDAQCLKLLQQLTYCCDPSYYSRMTVDRLIKYTTAAV